MISVRRVGAVFAGLALAGWLLAPARGTDGPADAPPAGPAKPAGVPVDVTRADESVVSGVFTAPTVTLKTGYGTVALDVAKVRTLELDAPDGPGQPVQVYAALSDKSRVAGPLQDPHLAVTVDGRPQQLDPADVRRVEFRHPKDPSWAAAIVGLVTLTLLEVVLGVDNVIFLAIIAAKLPRERQPRARQIGLLAALGTRLGLLATLSFLLGLTRPVVHLPELPFLESPEARGVSWRDLILLVGGAFLIGKSVFEMHEKLDRARADAAGTPRRVASFASVIVQIAIIDIIFSLDSVITAVGMVGELWVMVTAMLIAVGVMLAAAGPIARFVDRHPTVKVLALSFLILIGALLVAEALGQHIDKGYLYFAMAFAVAVELVNLRLRGSPAPAARELPAGPSPEA